MLSLSVLVEVEPPSGEIEVGDSAASLRNADLTSAHLDSADLRGTDLSDATFHGAALIGGDLAKARVGGADLSHADLRNTNLDDVVGWREVASLQGANIFGVLNPPDGFRHWALDVMGAVSVNSDDILPEVCPDDYPDD
jgi:uncharacterized protein YjbI with pentapeptide repeats